MFLQSHDNFDEFALFDAKTEGLSFYSKDRHPELVADRIDGFYGKVDGKLCAIFRKEGELYLRIETQEFPITDQMSSNFYKRSATNVFELLNNQRVSFRVEYKPPALLVSIELDPTPFVGYEDFDFWYFVHNILRDARRRQSIFNYPSLNC